MDDRSEKLTSSVFRPEWGINHQQYMISNIIDELIIGNKQLEAFIYGPNHSVPLKNGGIDRTTLLSLVAPSCPSNLGPSQLDYPGHELLEEKVSQFSRFSICYSLKKAVAPCGLLLNQGPPGQKKSKRSPPPMYELTDPILFLLLWFRL